MQDLWPVEDSITDGNLQLKESRWKTVPPKYKKERTYFYFSFFNGGHVAVIGVKSLIRLCCLNDKGGFGSHLGCYRAHC